MIVQYIILAVIIGLAAWYIVKKVRAPFHKEEECGGGCAKCSALDNIKKVKDSSS